jgi:tubulin polyglutamylase TTLL6/13
MKPKEMGSPL